MKRKPFNPDKKRLQRKIHRYVKAAIADSWKGGGDPEDIPDIEQEYQAASELVFWEIWHLFEYLEKVKCRT